MSKELVNDILQKIELLTFDEKLFLTNRLLEETSLDDDKSRVSINNQQTNQGGQGKHKQNLQWLEKHRNQYANQWVVLQAGQLISHGQSSRDVLAQARELGIKIPFIIYVEAEDALPFAGW